MERKDERENYREKPKKKEEYVKGADMGRSAVGSVPTTYLLSFRDVALSIPFIKICEGV
jgi:hypothetical protein